MVTERIIQRTARVHIHCRYGHAVGRVPVPERDGEGVVADEFAEDPLVEVEVEAVEWEEEPRGVDLKVDRIAGHVVCPVAVGAVDVGLLKVVPRVVGAESLHGSHGLRVLGDVGFVYEVGGWADSDSGVRWWAEIKNLIGAHGETAGDEGLVVGLLRRLALQQVRRRHWLGHCLVEASNAEDNEEECRGNWEGGHCFGWLWVVLVFVLIHIIERGIFRIFGGACNHVYGRLRP